MGPSSPEGAPLPESVRRRGSETGSIVETRDKREDVLIAFTNAFEQFDKFEESKLTPEQQAGRDLLREVKSKTLDQGKFSYVKRFKGDDGKQYSQKEYIPTDQIITFLRQRIKSGELSPEEEAKYREQEAILHRNSQEYYRGRGKKEYSRKMARIRAEAERIIKDPRLTTGDPSKDFLKASESLMERRELIVPADKPEVTEPSVTETPIEEPPVEEEPTSSGPIGNPRRELLIANRTEEVWKRARAEAELVVREEQRRGNAWNPLNWARKIRMRVGEEYYRQVYTERAYRAMIDNNNSYLQMDVVRNAAIQAQARKTEEVEAGKAKIEQLRSGEVFSGQQVREAQGELRTLLLNEVLRPMVQNAGMTEAQIQQTIRDFIARHENNHIALDSNNPNAGTVGSQLRDLFGRDVNLTGRTAEYFASDIKELADAIREDMAAHRYALEQMDQHVRIQLANTGWAYDTQANFNYVDRMVRWSESGRVRGWLINPATIGAAASLVTFGGIKLLGVGGRAATFLVPGAGVIVGAGIAAVRRNYDLKVDMAAHRAELAMGGVTPANARRREALNDYIQNMASFDEIENGGGTELVGGGTRRAISELLTSDLTQSDNQEALIRRMAEVKTRMDYSSANQLDMISFSSGSRIEQHRLKLTQDIVAGKLALRAAGLSDEDINYMMNAFGGEWSYQLFRTQQEQDRRFYWYRMRNAAGAGAFGGLVGLAGGLVGQQVIAVGARGVEFALRNAGEIVPDSVEGVAKSLMNTVTPGLSKAFEAARNTPTPLTGRTAIEKGLETIGVLGPETPPVPAGSVTREMLNDLFNKPGTLKISDEIYLNVDGHTPNTYNASFASIPNYAEAVPHTLEQQVPSTQLYSTPPLRVGPGWIEMSGSEADQQTISKLPTPLRDLLINWTREENVIDDDRYNIQHKLTEVLNSGKSAGFAHGNLEVAYGDLSEPGSDNPSKSISIRLLQDHLEDPKIRYTQADGEDLWGRVKPEFEHLRQHAIVLNGTSEMTNNGPVTRFEPGLNSETFSRVNPDGTKVSDVILRELAKNQWRVEGDPSFDKIFSEYPPKAMRLTPLELPLSEAPPIIPFPFAPRHPLEPMEPEPTLPPPTYYSGESLESSRKWLSKRPESHKPYKKIRNDGGSEIWVDGEGNPVERNLDRERAEITKFLEELKISDPGHYRQLQELLPKISTMNSRTRVAVNIPAWMEGKNLYRLLDEYTKQTDDKGNELGPELYEINIIVNRKTGTTPDDSVAEIERFKKDAEARGKKFQINYIDVEFPEPFNNVGNARRVITNLTLMRSALRPSQEGPLYIESEDADLINVDRKTVVNLITKLDENPHLDAVRGIQDRLPEKMMENDFLFLYRRMQDFKEFLIRRKAYRPERNPSANFSWNRTITGGWNTGYTAEAYALIGGYNPYQTKGEDMIMGERMSMVRGDGLTPNTEVIGRVGTRSDSSPRRYIYEAATGQAAYGSNFEDPAVNALIRNGTPEQLMARISHLSRLNNANFVMFQSMVNNEYQFIRSTTPNELEAKKVVAFILLYLGFKKGDYEIKPDGTIEIKSWDNVQTALNNYRERHKNPKPDGIRTGYNNTEIAPSAPKPIISGRFGRRVGGRRSPLTRTAPTTLVAPTALSAPVRRIVPSGPTTLVAPTTPTTPVAPTAPTIPSSLDIVAEMNKNISESTGTTASYETTPTSLVEYFKTLDLPGGSKIKTMTSSIIDGGGSKQISTSGVISTPAGDAPFTLVLENDPAGGLRVVSKEVRLPLLARGYQGRVDDYLNNLDANLREQVNKKTDPNWETSEIKITDGKISMSFKKK